MTVTVSSDSSNMLVYLSRIEVLLTAINEKLSVSGGTSSVEIKTSTRGVDTAVKAYSGVPVEPAGDAAMNEFVRVTEELTKRLMGDAR